MKAILNFFFENSDSNLDDEFAFFKSELFADDIDDTQILNNELVYNRQNFFENKKYTLYKEIEQEYTDKIKMANEQHNKLKIIQDKFNKGEDVPQDIRLEDLTCDLDEEYENSKKNILNENYKKTHQVCKNIFNEEYEYFINSRKDDEYEINQDILPDSIKTRELNFENTNDLYEKMIKERKKQISPLDKKYDISYNEKLKNHISIIKETIKPNDSKFYKNVEI